MARGSTHRETPSANSVIVITAVFPIAAGPPTYMSAERLMTLTLAECSQRARQCKRLLFVLFNCLFCPFVLLGNIEQLLFVLFNCLFCPFVLVGNIEQIAFCPVQSPFCPFVLLDNIEQLRFKRLLADGMRAADKRRTSACPNGSSQQQSFISSPRELSDP
jgi:hypothetical protein